MGNGERLTGKRPGKGRSRRLSVMLCDHCRCKDRCPEYRAGQECVYEDAEKFPELANNRRILALLREIIASDLISLFRAKRLEALEGGKIDNDAARLAATLVKTIETYTGIAERLATSGRSMTAGRIPEVQEILLAASRDKLFSEIGDDSLRQRLVAQFLQALDMEQRVLEQVREIVGQ